jgi:hypothetical protein
MKAERNIPEVVKISQVASETKPPEPLYKGLPLIEELVPFLETSTTYPSADDCENLSRSAFYRATRLLELLGWGEETLENELGTSREPALYYATDGIALQVEIMRLAAKTLFKVSSGDTFAHKPR